MLNGAQHPTGKREQSTEPSGTGAERDEHGAVIQLLQPGSLVGNHGLPISGTPPSRSGRFTAIEYLCGTIQLKAPGDHRAGTALRVKSSICFASPIHLHAMGL